VSNRPVIGEPSHGSLPGLSCQLGNDACTPFANRKGRIGGYAEDCNPIVLRDLLQIWPEGAAERSLKKAAQDCREDQRNDCSDQWSMPFLRLDPK
jgi:hypothetical protein